MQKKVLIKGAGDIATAVGHKLFRSGFKVVMTDVEKPTCIRRHVSFANSIYEGQWQVEGIMAKRAVTIQDITNILEDGAIPVIADGYGNIKNEMKFDFLVDAILAKKNTGTHIDDAPIVIGLGPGFVAGIDVDMVIETNRGHNLGRIIFHGCSEANTGVPGDIGGYTTERVLRAPAEGEIKNLKVIGDIVKKDDVIALVEDKEIKSNIAGIIRGLIYDGTTVSKGYKIGDVDPRGDISFVTTISDKGRCIAGGVLEAILMKSNE
ncbi:selenium-dependent molybdenum cofactor biosynthesis protein YqeB [Alkaliphilus peptidifermentans]|uniref:Xanthine dehydrogenase accessory factor n=1 Tax=Alkaliphilus peptidifermentans DSM 18978 TaxID=1120976 RepID=A0A1G5IAZ8_9FIRM|nr:selenium-dependent molybdenum cofactor biosynthesis protein YqeB [Alkaliphilus peptidifermentans]SCY73276.1 xanthine dehydrogenase accessory factor [Alkaliphilus peptidifermentans DSM 18978]